MAAEEEAKDEKRNLEQDLKMKKDTYNRTKAWNDGGQANINTKQAAFDAMSAGAAKDTAGTELDAMKATFAEAQTKLV